MDKKVERFLGINMDLVDGNISISNGTLVDSITRRFCMAEAKASSTPVSSGTWIHKNESGPVTDAPYHELVGTLLYLANTVCLDISFTFVRLSQFFSEPRESH